MFYQKSTYERDLGLLFDDLEDLPELLHPVVLGEHHLLPRLRHRRPLLCALPAHPDDGVGERSRVSRWERVARVAIETDLGMVARWQKGSNFAA